MIIFESDILDLREQIKPYMSERRYLHTLGVERAVIRLGDILMPHMVSELRVAALLHDIAKDISKEEQLTLISTYYDHISDEDISTVPALHSFAGPPLIKRDFSKYALESILCAVRLHTLGAFGMSLFDEIVFLSDFIEDTREYPVCKAVAEFVYTGLSPKNTHQENLAVLHRAALMSIDHTIASVESRGQKVNSSALKTKEYLLTLLKD